MKNDLLMTVFLSVFGFLVSWSLGLIPYVGAILALAIQLLLGWGLGWILMPQWYKFFIGLATLGGFLLGFNSGSWSERPLGFRTYLAISIACLLFCLAFHRGSSECKKDETQDI